MVNFTYKSVLLQVPLSIILHCVYMALYKFLYYKNLYMHDCIKWLFLLLTELKYNSMKCM